MQQGPLERRPLNPMKAADLSGPSIAKLPKPYEALCRWHLPRTLHDEIELETVSGIIDLRAGHALNADQADYLEALAELVEPSTHPAARISPHDAS